jgi:hypothetical protein
MKQRFNLARIGTDHHGAGWQRRPNGRDSGFLFCSTCSRKGRSPEPVRRSTVFRQRSLSELLFRLDEDIQYPSQFGVDDLFAFPSQAHVPGPGRLRRQLHPRPLSLSGYSSLGRLQMTVC